MTRKGYFAEYKCKQKNEKIFGKGNVIKIAIGGSSDYIIICKGELVKIIEVKETTKKNYYPRPNEKRQFNELIKLGKQHKVPVELWIYFRKGKGKPTINHIKYLYSPGDSRKNYLRGRHYA
jgi:hypothetical protein